jgi:hypothetical protein
MPQQRDPTTPANAVAGSLALPREGVVSGIVPELSSSSRSNNLHDLSQRAESVEGQCDDACCGEALATASRGRSGSQAYDWAERRKSHPSKLAAELLPPTTPRVF